MAIAFVQSKSASAGGVASLAITFTSNVTAASLLISGLFDGGGVNLTDTVTDSNNAGNWNLDRTGNLATDGDTVGVFSRVNAASGATTVTGHGTSIAGMGIHEYSGIATTTPLDQKLSANATGTSATSGNVTTTSASELIFGYLGTSGSGDTVTHGTGYTQRENNPNAHCFTEDQIVAGTGTFAATFTIGASDEYNSIIATYTAAGGGGGVSANLTGQTATFTEGSPTRALAYSPTGQTATFTEGIPSANVSYTLSGQTATFSEGALTAAWSGSATLGGQTATFTEGTLAPQVSTALTGQTATFTEGSPAPAVSYGLTAQSASFTEGTITAQAGGDVTIQLSGLQAVFALGQITATGGDVIGGGSNAGGGGGASPSWSGKFEFSRRPDAAELAHEALEQVPRGTPLVAATLPENSATILTEALIARTVQAQDDDDEEAIALLLQ